MPSPKFQDVILLHDSDDSPNGLPEEFETLLKPSFPENRFLRPVMPVRAGIRATAVFESASIRFLPMIKPNSLLVGFGLSGLMACALQQRFPSLGVSVFAINSPVAQDGLRLEYSPDRASIYSSKFDRISGVADWQPFADQFFDVDWLGAGAEHAVTASAYLVAAFMRGMDLKTEINTLGLSLPDSKAATI